MSESYKWGDWDSCEKCKPLIEKHSKEFGGFILGALCSEHEELRDYFGYFNRYSVPYTFFEKWKMGKEVTFEDEKEWNLIDRRDNKDES